MKGQTVILRTLGNKPTLAKIWDALDDTITICSLENYKNLESGNPGLMPIGFKSKDVFAWSPSLEAHISDDPLYQPDWSSLTEWRDSTAID